jgi:SAM-dependent methyltransferase
MMFSQTAQYYDKIYAFKDYQAEVQRLTAIVRGHLRSGGNRLLDVACGTGGHIEHLKGHFDVEGLDIAEDLLEIARARHSTIRFHHADMTDFDLAREFDVVTCLFSSIGYVKTLHTLGRAIACMARHVAPGGLLVVEPWFTPDAWHTPSAHIQVIDEPDLKIARVNTSFVDGRLSYFDLHYLIGTLKGTDHFVERHELGLFEVEEMRAAFAGAGLEVTYDEEGLIGRGLYVGSRTL